MFELGASLVPIQIEKLAECDTDLTDAAVRIE
jgi:hypothetical protein